MSGELDLENRMDIYSIANETTVRIYGEVRGFVVPPSDG